MSVIMKVVDRRPPLPQDVDDFPQHPVEVFREKHSRREVKGGLS
jgi:hypothetical protein